MINFYGTEIDIWAGFGLVGSIEKKIRQILSKFWGCFFMFYNFKSFWKYRSFRTKKWYKMKVKKFDFFLKNLIVNFK